MRTSPLPIPDLFVVTPRRIGDSRGYFSEVFKESWFRAHVADVGFVQDNESLSAAAGTLRGLHFQLPPFAQGKLVRCVSGAIFDVGVDIRRGSPSFGQWAGAELSAENGRQLFIPEGFAHGFATLLPDTVVQYKVTAPYSAAHDRGILWNDPDIAIEWALSGLSPVLSDKDRALPRLADIGPAFQYVAAKKDQGA